LADVGQPQFRVVAEKAEQLCSLGDRLHRIARAWHTRAGVVRSLPNHTCDPLVAAEAVCKKKLLRELYKKKLLREL